MMSGTKVLVFSTLLFVNMCYRRFIKLLSRYKFDIAPHVQKMLREWPCKEDFALAHSALAKKTEQLTDEEVYRASAYLSLGFFPELDEREKCAAYCIVLDAEYERELNEHIRACSPYTGDEAIFDDRELRDYRKKDLIEGKVGDRLPNSNIFKRGNKWGYFDRRIPLQFYDWIENCFADKTTRIRVEPHKLYDHCPPQLILECMVVPPRMKWWKNLTIHVGNYSGGRYILLGNDVTNLEDYQDYHFHNVRELQVIATRKKTNYISMMIEELSEYNHPTDPSRKYVLGRMIHLDSTAEFGTPFENAVLKHIDLTFNLYIDGDATVRMSQSLSDGSKVQDATHRTHILRIEDIPFESLFKIAISFFRSKYLTTEWLGYEFA